jgi:hypothetical protein
MSLLEELLIENRNMRKALEFIVAWDLPKLPDHSGKLVSYGLQRGSNGERDYMKQVAKEAL